MLLALDEALVGLLERQRDPPPLQVDVDDLDHDLGADLDDLLGDLDVPLGQLGDVHQALNAVVDADERAERDQLGDLARDDLLDRVGPGELPPRVFLGRLQRQRDALAVQVDVEHLDLDLLADLDNLGGVVDVLPGELGDVHQAVHAAKVDERAEVDDRGDDALADLALLQLVEELGTHLGLGLLEVGPAGQHHVVAVLVQLDDLRLELPADVRLQVRTRRISTREAGRKPRRPMSRIRPPLTTSMTWPRTTPSSSLIFSMVPHARSYCARFFERISRPSLSSFVRTRASM